MNSLERVLSAVSGKPSGRRAVLLTLSLYGAKLTGCPLYEFYNDASKYADGQLAVKETFGTDVLLTPFVLTSIAEAFGSQVKYFSQSPPNMVKPAAPSFADFMKIDMSAVAEHPKIGYLHEAAAKIAAVRGKDTAVAAFFLSPVDLAPLVMGIEAWLEIILFDEAGAKKIIEAMSGFFIKTVNGFFERGAHLAALPAAFCNPMIATKKIVDEIALPSMKEAFAQLKGPVVIHHAGAPMLEFVDSLNELPNVIGFTVDQTDALDKVRDKTGVSKVLLGNIDGPTLNKRTPEQIRARCMSILNGRRDDPRFILASSSADIAFSTPEENIRAIIEAAEEFGEGI